MRSEGYSSCPVCVCVCVFVCLQAILAVRAITSKSKDTIMLNIEFGEKLKGYFSFKCLVRKLEHFYLPRQRQPFCLAVQFTCNVLWWPLHICLHVTHVHALYGPCVLGVY